MATKITTELQIQSFSISVSFRRETKANECDRDRAPACGVNNASRPNSHADISMLSAICLIFSAGFFSSLLLSRPRHFHNYRLTFDFVWKCHNHILVKRFVSVFFLFAAQFNLFMLMSFNTLTHIYTDTHTHTFIRTNTICINLL